MGWSSIFDPKLYLADDPPPTVGTVSGSVTTDTTWKGTEGISYSAADLGGGIARLRLYVDRQPTAVDHVINPNNGHCQISGAETGPGSSLAQAVPGAVNTEELIDTTAIADGQHTITLKVVDAAQQEATVWTGARLVANHPPVNVQLPAFRDNATFVNPLIWRAHHRVERWHLDRAEPQHLARVGAVRWPRDAAVLRCDPGRHRVELHADGGRRRAPPAAGLSPRPTRRTR